MEEIDTGYNLAALSVELHKKYTSFLEKETEKKIAEVEALYDKLDKLIELRSKLLEDSKKNPTSLDYNKDKKTQKLIDFFHEEIGVEKQEKDDFYSFDKEDITIILDRLDLLCKKYQNLAHTKSMQIHPELLKTLEITHIAANMQRDERESTSHIVRKSSGG